MGCGRVEDKALIEAFVKDLREHGNPGLHVERWPDAENRRSRDIDAVAGRFAIEHASVDTVVHQRRDDARFMRVVGGLKDEFRGRMSFRLRLVLPWESIRVGQDWSAIKSAFRGWISEEARVLADGKRTIENAPGIPFPFSVEKLSDRPPGVFFGRHAPTDSSLSRRLREILDGKASKLKPYRDSGFTTILLIESSDIALMNEDILVGAMREAYPNGLARRVDQVWYADTSVAGDGPVFSDITQDIIA